MYKCTYTVLDFSGGLLDVDFSLVPPLFGTGWSTPALPEPAVSAPAI